MTGVYPARRVADFEACTETKLKKIKRKSRPQDKRSNRLVKQGGTRAIYRTEKSHKKGLRSKPQKTTATGDSVRNCARWIYRNNETLKRFFFG